MTEATFQKFSKALNLGPADISKFANSDSQAATENRYYMIQQDAFSAMSEWYFDAILELALIPNFKMEPEVISASIGITNLQAKIALETLERLELLQKNTEGRYTLRHQNSINILDSDFTSAANRKYQKSVLEKSLDAVDSIDRKKRDHTSTTIAINANDLPKAKQLIQKFRHDLNAFLQRDGASPDEVYQLQVSFFPLTQMTDSKKQENP